MIALRQAGFEPVVASMGTALTERQLKELGRLTRRLCLCFDGDAAGEAATLRGMELAAAQGLDVRVVALPPGIDPADAADGFEERLAGAETYLLYRVRLELERAPDRQEAFVRVREVLARARTRPSARRRCGCSPTGSTCRARLQAGLAPRRRRARAPDRVAAAAATRATGSSATRSRPASRIRCWCSCSPSSGPTTSTTSPDRRAAPSSSGRVRTTSSSGSSPSSTRARPRRASTSAPARELLLRLRERKLRRELAAADSSGRPSCRPRSPARAARDRRARLRPGYNCRRYGPA